MSAKYHRIPQSPLSDQEEDVESGMKDGSGLDFASPFTYSSIFSYERGKTFKSPFTYNTSGFAKPNAELEKDNKGSSVARNVVETMVIIFCYIVLVMGFPLSLLFSLKFISQFERLVVFRLGRLQDAKGPGAVLVLPCIDSCKRVDMRMKAFNVPPLQAITCDGGVIELGATVFYRVKDVLASVLKVQDFNKALRNLAHSVVHRLVNKHPFQIIEKDRKILRDELQEELNKAAFNWGMEVGNVEMSDLRVIRQPEPQANNALRTLMQPQIMSTLWKAVSGSDGPPPEQLAQLSSMAFPMQQMLNNGVPTDPPVQEMLDLSTAPSTGPQGNDELTKFVDFIQQAVSDSLADEIGQSYQIDCRGLGEFYMHFKRPMVCVGVGRLESVDATISMARDDLIDLLSEKLSPLDAYLSGRLAITGDTKAALRMQPLYARLRPFLRANALNSSFSSQQ